MVPVQKRNETGRNQSKPIETNQIERKKNKNEYPIMPKCYQYSSNLIHNDLYIDCQ